MELLRQTSGVDEQVIRDFKKTEIIRRQIQHVKSYAADLTSPRKYDKVKSKVRQNMNSQIRAKHTKSQMELQRSEDDSVVRELSQGRKFSEIPHIKQFMSKIVVTTSD